LVTTVPDLLAAQPGLVVECAGHGAVDAYGTDVLAGGADLLVASLGALADRQRLGRLKAAAERAGASLIVPSGAVGGLDLLAAARVAGLSRVTYVSRKPPRAWKGTPAENLADLDALAAATTFYTGPADAAARDYPQNANVAAAVALAGLGFERTQVQLVADPAAPGNLHRIEAEGAFGRTEIVIEGRPLPDNPKTSMLAALSLVRAVLNRGAALVV
jgi:aspartate dehydrogenase